MRSSWWILAVQFGLALFAAEFCFGAERVALLDIQTDKERMEGRIAAHNDEFCWILRRDGRLSAVRMDDVTDFREIQPKFKPFSSIDLRDKLQAEFGKAFEVKTTVHYIVVATRGTADRYATLFEGIYRQFHTYFTTRGFRINEPEFPMVAVVFPEEKSFFDYCVSEGAKPQEGMVGYYLPSSNRVALFDRAASGEATDEAVNDTVIHEGIHQVAFNTGVHTRMGPSPVWLVEGLATMLEAEGMRKRQSSSPAVERINPERLDRFREYRLRRPPNSLGTFVRDDRMFQSATLDAYGQAWALTFYLTETRPAEFAKYMKRVADRNPMEPYSSDARFKDFTEAFGRDLEFLELGMLRYFERLERLEQ